MALIKCKECGEQVSTKAQTCPKCGAPPPKKTSVVTWLVLLGIVIAIYAASKSPPTSKQIPEPKKELSLSSLSEEEKAAKSSELITKLKAVPMSNYAVNHRMYSSLVELNPSEQKYKSKVAFYAQKMKEAEAERARLANLNKTGIWKLGNYVDDFGEPTSSRYIKTNLTGTFSNTATQDSALNVRLLISNPADISIMLFEYARNNPVKNYGDGDQYTVLVQDNESVRMRLEATNYSERLSFDKANSAKLNSVFMKGGKVQFRIVDKNTPTSKYQFMISNANYYKNAVRKLKEG